MRKFISSFIASIALAGMVSACAVELPADEQVGLGDQAVTACSNAEGTNAMIAALAVAIAQEVGRWKVGTDLKQATCTYNQQCLVLTPAAYEQCRLVAKKPVGTPQNQLCINTNAILALQDAKYDQKFIFPDGTKLSSYSYAARLFSGWNEQKTCEARPSNNTSNPNNCPAEEHKLTLAPNGIQPGAPGACDTYYTFDATDTKGKKLVAPSLLKNKLLWTGYRGLPGNVGNPFIDFRSTATTVTIDPTYGLNAPEQQTGGSCMVWPATSKYSATKKAGECCKKSDTSPNAKLVQTSPNMLKCG